MWGLTVNEVFSVQNQDNFGRYYSMELAHVFCCAKIQTIHNDITTLKRLFNILHYTIVRNRYVEGKLMAKQLQDYHVEYMDVLRHWSPRSEKYSGGDSLLTALYNGWELNETIYVEEAWHTGMRHAPLYHFELERDGETETMVVIDNPYVWRLSNKPEFRVLPLSERPKATKKAKN
jgi:hypothetical protein